MAPTAPSPPDSFLAVCFSLRPLLSLSAPQPTPRETEEAWGLRTALQRSGVLATEAHKTAEEVHPLCQLCSSFTGMHSNAKYTSMFTIKPMSPVLPKGVLQEAGPTQELSPWFHTRLTNRSKPTAPWLANLCLRDLGDSGDQECSCPCGHAGTAPLTVHLLAG